MPLLGPVRGVCKHSCSGFVKLKAKIRTRFFFRARHMEIRVPCGFDPISRDIFLAWDV